MSRSHRRSRSFTRRLISGTAKKGTSFRHSPRCRSSMATTRSSARGWWTVSPAAWACGSPMARSPATARGSYRTSSSEEPYSEEPYIVRGRLSRVNLMQRFRRHVISLTVAALAALIGAPLAAQNGAAPSAPPAMPEKLAPSGVVVPSAAWQQRVQNEVKAPDGFKVTLFAEPPYAEYPVCVTSSLDGVVFVGTDPNLAQDFVKGRGRIVRLVDENGDGHADKYTVFTEVDSPRGLIWDGKALYVLHPPNLTAYYDDNGDGIADRSVDLVRGISAASLDIRSADHSTNGITLGIDAWIYIAVGDYGFTKAIGTDGIQLSNHVAGVLRVRTDAPSLEMYSNQ